MSDFDGLERELVKIWEQVLGRHGIGVHTNFWDLGGTSLIALRMVRRLEQLGWSLPIATLLQVTTVSELAAMLRRVRPSAAWSSLVAIQPNGANPPLYCIHAMGGLAAGFRPLARRLGENQPLYGLQSPGLDGKGEILARVEDMAAHYLREIRTVQPHGPYYFVGRCFGGWIAYEMAQQVRGQGDQVALLALLDTYPVNWSKAALIVKLMKMPALESLKLIFQKVRLLGRMLRINIQRLFLPRALKEVRNGLRLAAAAYVPRPYSGSITVFRARRESLRSWGDPTSGWGQLTSGPFYIEEVPGDHNSMLAEPAVAFLAKQLNARIERAREESNMRKVERVESVAS